ncbi:hypothetical protein ACFSCW_03910 [Sphingomonas tabacisoli]|uniref:Uncharacterized protein n=1 Tax=Sphingomonas tabacisoli TaxID=2249466 RepID=A0ABW4I077_9SPHN
MKVWIVARVDHIDYELTGWALLAGLAIYVLAYWFVSRGPSSHMEALRQRGLRPIFATLYDYKGRLARSENRDEALEVQNSYRCEDEKIDEWLEQNMGAAARAKYNSGSPESWAFIVNASDEKTLTRNQIAPTLAEIDLKLKNIDEMMESDRWAAVQPSAWRWQAVNKYE